MFFSGDLEISGRGKTPPGGEDEITVTVESAGDATLTDGGSDFVVIDRTTLPTWGEKAAGFFGCLGTAAYSYYFESQGEREIASGNRAEGIELLQKAFRVNTDAKLVPGAMRVGLKLFDVLAKPDDARQRDIPRALHVMERLERELLEPARTHSVHEAAATLRTVQKNIVDLKVAEAEAAMSPNIEVVFTVFGTPNNPRQWEAGFDKAHAALRTAFLAYRFAINEKVDAKDINIQEFLDTKALFSVAEKVRLSADEHMDQGNFLLAAKEYNFVTMVYTIINHPRPKMGEFTLPYQTAEQEIDALFKAASRLPLEATAQKLEIFGEILRVTVETNAAAVRIINLHDAAERAGVRIEDLELQIPSFERLEESAYRNYKVAVVELGAMDSASPEVLKLAYRFEAEGFRALARGDHAEAHHMLSKAYLHFRQAAKEGTDKDSFDSALMQAAKILIVTGDLYANSDSPSDIVIAQEKYGVASSFYMQTRNRAGLKTTAARLETAKGLNLRVEIEKKIDEALTIVNTSSNPYDIETAKLRLDAALQIMRSAVSAGASQTRVITMSCFEKLDTLVIKIRLLQMQTPPPDIAVDYPGLLVSAGELMSPKEQVVVTIAGDAGAKPVKRSEAPEAKPASSYVPPDVIEYGQDFIVRGNKESLRRFLERLSELTHRQISEADFKEALGAQGGELFEGITPYLSALSAEEHLSVIAKRLENSFRKGTERGKDRDKEDDDPLRRR